MLVALAASATVSVPALLGWLALPPTYLLSHFMPPLPQDERPLAIEEGVNEVVLVTTIGDGSRRLVTNGHPMSATQLKSQRYMRLFAMPLSS